MTNDHKVGVTAEAIVLTESIEMYTWIIQVMALMEPIGGVQQMLG